jgi:DNA-binding XRE family transcriptional regulator
VPDPAYEPGAEPIEVVPVVVLSQVFPARPSSIPQIREFVARCLAESPLTDEGNRQVGETVFRALLDAAGPTGSIQVAFRIFPEHVEVDVLHSDNQIPARQPLSPASGTSPVTPTVRSGPASYLSAFPATPAATGPGARAAARAGARDDQGATAGAAAAPGAGNGATAARPGAGNGATEAGPGSVTPAGPVTLGQPGHPATFAEWMSTALRREGLTQEAAARQLGVSVKTVSRWVGGATEPRMRDLRRIQEVFGQVPIR